MNQILTIKASDLTNNVFTNYTKINDVVAIELLSASIPYSWNTIMTGINDNLKFYSGTTTYSVILTAGLYSPSTLVTEIQTKMNAALAGFTVAVDSVKLQYTISHATTFKLLKSNSLTTLGFANADDSTATSHTSPYLYNLSYCLGVNMYSEKLSGLNHQFGNNTKNIMMNFIIDSQPGKYTIVKNTYDKQYILSSDKLFNLNNFDLKFVFADNDMNTINFNGIDWYVTLKIYTK